MRNHRYNILEAIVKTPLVKLEHFAPESTCQIFAKLEFLNPMGSIKDRVTRYMIEAAERDGRIQAGDMLLENSSGKTARGLAFMAIQKGYRLKVVIRDRICREKLDQLRVLGVEVLLADSSLPFEDTDSYNRITPVWTGRRPAATSPTSPATWRTMQPITMAPVLRSGSRWKTASMHSWVGQARGAGFPRVRSVTKVGLTSYEHMHSIELEVSHDCCTHPQDCHHQ